MELKDLVKFQPFTNSIDPNIPLKVGVHVFPEIEPQIHEDIDGKKWGIVYWKSKEGGLLADAAIRWFTIEEMEQEKETTSMLNVFTKVLSLIGV